jgi:predicted anti-sigma-YlaC factor YlaD
MTRLFESPTSEIVAVLLLIAAAYAITHGVRLVARALRDARALDLIRGIRVGIVGFVAGVSAVGVLSSRTGFVTMALIILGEELYETGVLAAIIRLGERGTRDTPSRS